MNSDSIVEVNLRVIGMMCQKNCGSTVGGALKALPGVVEAYATFDTSSAFVSIDTTNISNTDDFGDLNALSHEERIKKIEDTVVEAVENVGFDCHVLTENEMEEQRLGVINNDDKEDALDIHIGDKSPLLAPENNDLNNFSDVDEGAVGLFEVRGMSCAVCSGRVEKSFLTVPGVQSASVSVATNRAQVLFQPLNHIKSKEKQTREYKETAEKCASVVTGSGYECILISVNDKNNKNNGAGISLQDNAMRMQQIRTEELLSWRGNFISALLLTIPIVVLHYGFARHSSIEMNSQATGQFMTVSPPEWYEWVMLYLATPVQFGVGRRFYVSALSGAKHGVLGMDALIVLGTTSAYLYSIIIFSIHLFASTLSIQVEIQDNGHMPNNIYTLKSTFETGAMLITFVTFGKFLEAYAKGKTASALQKLMELQPVNASRVNHSNDPNYSNKNGNFDHLDQNVNIFSLETEELPITNIKINDVLVVSPGTRIPTDGVIIAREGSGEYSYIDESALSGEPFPVAKTIGDTVFGSCVNQLSTLLVRVTAVGSETILARIVKLVEDAQSSKAPIQALADQIAAIFAPIVISLASITFIGWYISDRNFAAAFMSAITVVVVACPCALGLATPTAVMVGTGVGAKNGLLIKGGSVLEEAHSINTVIFDKTGTLTTGRAVLRDYIQYLDEKISEPLSAITTNLPKKVEHKNIVLWLAACAESGSEHPLAFAIVNAAKRLWGEDFICATDGVKVSKSRIVPGQGVECIVEKVGWGKRIIRAGKISFIYGSDNNETEQNSTGDADIERLRKLGQVGICVGICENDIHDNSTVEEQTFQIIGIIGIVDPIECNAKSCCKALQNMGIEVWMCTGDHETTANAVAEQVGIRPSNICAGSSPEGKADLVTRLQKRRGGKGRVAVVGDGINDSIALARANVGIAIGAGTEVAVEAADIVLVKSSLHDVVVALHLSRIVFRRIKLNFIWAMGYNLFALPFAAGILYPFTGWKLPPAFAGLMMAFSSVSVVTSSLLLRMYSKPIINEDGSIKGNGICAKVCGMGTSMMRKNQNRYESASSESENITHVELIYA